MALFTKVLLNSRLLGQFAAVELNLDWAVAGDQEGFQQDMYGSIIPVSCSYVRRVS